VLDRVQLPFMDGAALVTGGANGIGRAVVEALAAPGVPVASVDTELPAKAGMQHVLDLQRDVRDFEQAASAVREAEAQLGPVTILVGCAGIRLDAASWKMSEESWREVLDVDLTGCFTFARAVIPRMRELGRGRIVFISSINALRGKFGQANYAAAKAGLVGLGKALACELGPRQITVNVVAPGMIHTAMTASLDPKFLDEARREAVLGHLGEPEDVAATVLYLCSDLARHVTGEVIRVDGGQAM
jgi:acetoacetyl-CoA reductase/3-oxoacyl-[acyl-carrier protein] reductase